MKIKVGVRGSANDALSKGLAEGVREMMERFTNTAKR